MPKRPEIGPTLGKVTYIHGGLPRTTLEQLEAGEADISQYPLELPPEGLRAIHWPPQGDYEPMPAAPSISVYGSPGIIIGVDVASEPDVTVQGFYGAPATQSFKWSEPQDPDSWGFSEADELDIWAPDQNQAPDHLPPVDFHAIVVAGLLILIMTFLAIGIINLYPTTIFAEFLPRITLPR